MGFLKRFYIAFVYYAMTMMVRAKGNVVLMGHNISKSFDDMEANFTPRIKGSGESGILYISDPLDACFPLNNKNIGSMKSPFVLIVRGGCSFDDKVRNAQNAGFKAAIIYDSEENAPLVAMGGTQLGVKIHAVFISKDSGKELMKYTNSSTVDIWILPTFEDSPWSIMAVSFIALLAMSAVLATCFFVHKHHGRQEMNIAAAAPPVQEFHGMSRRLVKAMPSLIFTTVLEDKSTSCTCAICLDDYSTGEKIRVLPCFHKFHAICVDSWLTSWRTFCPVCKRDARTSIDIPLASESTPLLSSLASSSSALNLPSYPSSLAASSSIPIVPSHPLSTSRPHSLSTSHNHLSNSYTYNNSLRSQIPTYITPNSLTHKYMPSYSNNNNNGSSINVCGSSNATPSYNYLVGSPSNIHSYSHRYMNGSPAYHVGSSSRLSYLNRCESNSSVSVLASTHSLPAC